MRESNLSTKKVFKNTVINFTGLVAPLIVGLYTIPQILLFLGQERFSLLTILWMVVGYFTLFDLGLGRAVTKIVADKIGQKLNDDIPIIFWTANLIMFLLGILGSIFLISFGSSLIENFFNVSSELQPELKSVIVFLAISLPIIILTSGFKAVIEAHQNFVFLNVIQIFLGLFTYLCPLFLSTPDLADVVGLLFLGRVVQLLALIFFTFKIFPSLLRVPVLQIKLNFKKESLALFRIGGWLTISNIVGPIMVYFDRFFLGAMVPMVTVAYYTTPFEMVSRLNLLPSALVRVLFPAFATAQFENQVQMKRLFFRSLIGVSICLFIPCALIFIFAKWGLTLWLGESFAHNSSLILQILTVGVFLNCLALIPYTLLQSLNQARLTALIHLFELPFYLGSLYFFISHFGIIGAAITWTLRVLIDTALMFYFSLRFLKDSDVQLSTDISLKNET